MSIKNKIKEAKKFINNTISYIKDIYNFLKIKNKRTYFKDMIEENKKMDKIILDARQELYWLKTVASGNRYSSSDTILQSVSKKLDELEEILERNN